MIPASVGKEAVAQTADYPAFSYIRIIKFGNRPDTGYKKAGLAGCKISFQKTKQNLYHLPYIRKNCRLLSWQCFRYIFIERH